MNKTIGRPRVLTERQEARLLKLREQGWTYRKLRIEFGLKSDMSAYAYVNRNWHARYYRRYRKANKATLRQYYLDHQEEFRRRGREYYHNNIDAMRAANRKRYAANAKKFIQRTIEWRKRNPDKVRQYRLQYKARMQQ
jgi:hypothetical protein